MDIVSKISSVYNYIGIFQWEYLEEFTKRNILHSYWPKVSVK